ncbi:MAG: helix-turn-helix domain-containing protein [Bacteriovoracia bacterium]
MMDQGRIQNLRKKLGWKQKEMADALGIENPQTISHWEIGFRTPSGTAERLLLLLEKLRGKELQSITRHLEKISMEKSDA